MRAIATIEFYVYGHDERKLKYNAKIITREIDKRYDNCARVISLAKNEFGSLK